MNIDMKSISYRVHVPLAFCAMALISENALPFEEATHAAMTWQAYWQSQIGSSIEAQRKIGIEGALYSAASSSKPFGTAYVDVDTILRKRDVTGRPGTYDESFFPTGGRLGFQISLDRYKLGSWLMRGATREDDSPLIPLLANDDPVNAARPFNHFFDPVHNIPLTNGGAVAGTQLGKKNPDWALGSIDAFSDANARDGLRKNHFSVFDAREAMWRALTLRDKEMSPNIGVEGIADGEPLRKAYWATTFRALGDLVHMIQDMGQPQHTRNEPHNGSGTSVVQQNFTGHASVIERYIDARAAGAKAFVVTGSGSSTSLNISDLDMVFGLQYPVPRLANYTDYFSTTVASSPPASYAKAGYGLADYSNRRFFTAVKNLGHPDFQLPVSNPSEYSRCRNPDGSDLTSARWDGTPNTNGYKAAALCATSVSDELNPGQSASNVAITAESVWDAALSNAGQAKTYHMTREVYDAQARLLIPRAIAYSAGLIDYFFRGTLYVAPPTEGVFGLVDHGDPASYCKDNCGFTKIKLRVANDTPDVTPPVGSASPQGMTGGKLVAVAKFRRNSCYTSDLSGEYHGSGGVAEKIAYYNSCVAPQPEEIVVSTAMNVTGIPACSGNCDAVAVPYTFNFSSPIPINSASLSLQLVYRGVLGSETDAVAVQTVDVSEPSYFFFMNSSDYIKLGAEAYTREEINAPSATNLRSLVQPQSCIENDQLKATCAQSIPQIAFPLTWGSASSPGITSPLDLSVRSFSRFAMLLPPGTAGSVFQELSPCTPHLPMPVAGKRLQESIAIDTTQSPPAPLPPVYRSDYLVDPSSGIVRGIVGGSGVACVAVGDGEFVALPESAFVRMSTLTAQERVAKPIQGFVFGN